MMVCPHHRQYIASWDSYLYSIIPFRSDPTGFNLKSSLPTAVQVSHGNQNWSMSSNDVFFRFFFCSTENSHLDDLYTRYRQRLRKSLFISGLGISILCCLVSIVLCQLQTAVRWNYCFGSAAARGQFAWILFPSGVSFFLSLPLDKWVPVLWKNVRILWFHRFVLLVFFVPVSIQREFLLKYENILLKLDAKLVVYHSPLNSSLFQNSTKLVSQRIHELLHLPSIIKKKYEHFHSGFTTMTKNCSRSLHRTSRQRRKTLH